jgi:hypothetical protein
MPNLDAVPAIRRLDTDRPEVFAIEVFGHVSAADVENLYGLLEGAYALHDRLDLFLRVADYGGIDWADTDRGTVESTRDHARRHVRRCAAVGDSQAVAALIRIIRPAEAEIREFKADEEAQAWEWIGAREV